MCPAESWIEPACEMEMKRSGGRGDSLNIYREVDLALEGESFLIQMAQHRGRLLALLSHRFEALLNVVSEQWSCCQLTTVALLLCESGERITGH